MFKQLKLRLDEFLTKGAVTREHGEYLKQRKLREFSITTVQLLILVIFIVGWQLAANYKLIDPFITSHPLEIMKTIYRLALTGELVKHVGVTVCETLLGFGLGAGGGLIIATALWWSNYFSEVFEPYIIVLNALPKMALGPVLIIWLGNGMVAIIGMALLISIIVTVMMVYDGFQKSDQNKIKLLQTLGANRLEVFQKVVLPENLPTIFAAFKVNIGLSLVGVIVGEFLVSEAGLGYLIVYGGQVFKLNLVMSSVIILSILAGGLYYLVVLLEQRMISWNN
ncbi:MAG: ABC transporter permease [Bacillota bacterium]